MCTVTKWDPQMDPPIGDIPLGILGFAAGRIEFVRSALDSRLQPACAAVRQCGATWTCLCLELLESVWG